jgi:hypothetical protein
MRAKEVNMPTHAIAFHESVARDRFEELFASDSAQLFAGSQKLVCPKCAARFAVYLSLKDDPNNAFYVEQLKARIAENCGGGQHVVEARFTSTP